MFLGKIVDDRLHNFQVSSCKLMKNIKVRYFAFFSLLLTLFTTANRIKKTLHSLNHSILLSHRFFTVKIIKHSCRNRCRRNTNAKYYSTRQKTLCKKIHGDFSSGKHLALTWTEWFSNMLAAPAWFANSLFLQLVQQEKISFNSPSLIYKHVKRRKMTWLAFFFSSGSVVSTI
jgi:hypothetical protein